MYIPVSVLIAICEAIRSDERASFKAAETTIFVSVGFRSQLSVAIRQIRDLEVRKWAQNELTKARLCRETENDSLENQNTDLLNILHRAYSAIITLPTDGLGWQYDDKKKRLSIRDELLRAMNTELQKHKEKE